MPLTVTERVDLRRPPRQVLDLLADADFVVRRTAANATIEGRVIRHDVSEDEIVIETTARLPGDWLPSQVRGAAQALPTITRVERWDRLTGSGRTTFGISGLPGTADSSADMMITAHGDGGSRMTHVVTLSVAVPLVGGVLEQALAGQVSSALRAEFALYDSATTDRGSSDDVGTTHALEEQ